ncbi:PAS domain-containing protein [Sediminibacterium roseum]|uniref:histidine kinase n=1 Tax=Sediminibacterium roseum TaxID=1978412 RepID=A0ABW9ZWW0_9BACT|nr:PAS domain-containing sensor histidine kinase [Sediminibacterium roseum]NCI50533.1 PAS domain-containing protein [Sediminibacterium roseum]
MLESFLSDFAFIKETLDKGGNPDFLGKHFSFYSTEPVLFYNLETDRIIYMNERFEDEFQYTVEDLAKNNYSIFPLLHSDDHQPFREKILECLKNNDGNVSGCEYRLQSKQGKHNFYRVKLRKLYGSYYSVHLENISQLKEHDRLLEQKIEELNKSNQELEEFAYVASHDMQEPLRKISTFGQRLKTQFGNVLNEDGSMYLSRMMNASENMRNLIDNLLEFSRVSRNKQAFEKVDLSELLKATIDDLDLKIDETGAVVEVDELPAIEAIPSQMRQLFFNLLHNAIKFRKKDTSLVIRITQHVLSTQEKSNYQLPRAQEYFLIKIADNGIGFEQQYAERIFQLFQRLEGKSEYPGTGIGLSICRKIVVNHKGLIFAESEPGKGTAFSVILPKEQ